MSKKRARVSHNLPSKWNGLQVLGYFRTSLKKLSTQIVEENQTDVAQIARAVGEIIQERLIRARACTQCLCMCMCTRAMLLYFVGRARCRAQPLPLVTSGFIFRRDGIFGTRYARWCISFSRVKKRKG